MKRILITITCFILSFVFYDVAMQMEQKTAEEITDDIRQEMGIVSHKKRTRRKHGYRYNVTFELINGSTKKTRVTRDYYYSVEEGDVVQLYYYNGIYDISAKGVIREYSRNSIPMLGMIFCAGIGLFNVSLGIGLLGRKN